MTFLTEFSKSSFSNIISLSFSATSLAASSKSSSSFLILHFRFSFSSSISLLGLLPGELATERQGALRFSVENNLRGKRASLVEDLPAG